MTTPIRARYNLASTGQPEGHAKRATLLWGPSLTRKTSYALTWPSPLVIYFDPDSTTLELAPSPVPFIVISDVATLDRICEDVQRRRMTEIVRQMPGFEDYTVRTVIADSLTYLGRLIDNDLGEPNKSTWPAKKRIMHRSLLTLTEATKWRAGAEQYYLVATVHEQERCDSEGRVKEVTTAISGGFGQELFSYFSDVLVTRCTPSQTGNPKYYVRAAPPSALYRTVGMRGVLNPPAQLDDAMYPTLARYWYASTNPTQETENGNG